MLANEIQNRCSVLCPPVQLIFNSLKFVNYLTRTGGQTYITNTALIGRDLPKRQVKKVKIYFSLVYIRAVVALLFFVHGKHLRSCRDGQLT